MLRTHSKCVSFECGPPTTWPISDQANKATAGGPNKSCGAHRNRLLELSPNERRSEHLFQRWCQSKHSVFVFASRRRRERTPYLFAINFSSRVCGCTPLSIMRWARSYTGATARNHRFTCSLRALPASIVRRAHPPGKNRPRQLCRWRERVGAGWLAAWMHSLSRPQNSASTCGHRSLRWINKVSVRRPLILAGVRQMNRLICDLKRLCGHFFFVSGARSPANKKYAAGKSVDGESGMNMPVGRCLCEMRAFWRKIRAAVFCVWKRVELIFDIVKNRYPPTMINYSVTGKAYFLPSFQCHVKFWTHQRFLLGKKAIFCSL